MRLTLLGRADEVPDAPNTAIILALRFIQLHAHPLATGELRGPAEPQRARLEETREDMAWVALGGHDKITGTGKSLVVQWLRVSTFTAEGSGSVLGDLASCAEWPKKKKKSLANKQHGGVYEGAPGSNLSISAWTLPFTGYVT